MASGGLYPGAVRQRRWPSETPSTNAFWRSEASVLFIALAIFATGVFALEWARNVFTSAAVYSRRVIRFDFLAINKISNSLL